MCELYLDGEVERINNYVLQACVYFGARTEREYCEVQYNTSIKQMIFTSVPWDVSNSFIFIDFKSRESDIRCFASKEIAKFLEKERKQDDLPLAI